MEVILRKQLQKQARRHSALAAFMKKDPAMAWLREREDSKAFVMALETERPGKG